MIGSDNGEQAWFPKGTVLGSLSENDAFEFVRTLIACGNEADAVKVIEKAPKIARLADSSGLTLMMDAIFYRMERLAVRLMQASDPSSKNKAGKTLLMMAACHQLPELALALLPLSDPSAKTNNGDTALHLLFDVPRRDPREFSTIIEEMAAAGNPSERNADGWTALHAAVNSGWIEGVEILAPLTDLTARAKLFGGGTATAEEMARDGAGAQPSKLAMLDMLVSTRERQALDVATPKAAASARRRSI